ncbi:HD domain-containing protein [bacterium]|nr:HD domain-containing protein [bacterium]
MPSKRTLPYNRFFLQDADDILAEVQYICSLMKPDLDLSVMVAIYHDNLRLFQGEHEGFQACNTRYHDLDHTLAVFLATARLAHGVFLSGKEYTTDSVVLGLIGALFHDAGFIQTEDDTQGTGAKYTIGHEQRSIQFIRSYLPSKGFNNQQIEDCTHIIACTILNNSLDTIPFRSPEIKNMGQVVGSADLLAQMADRDYLEKLLYLYSEFEEAHIPGFDSELELLKKTESFYENQSKKRIEGTLGGIAPLMKLHFSNRWGIKRDLYQDYINKNITYLKEILDSCEGDYQHLLRRHSNKSR